MDREIEIKLEITEEEYQGIFTKLVENASKHSEKEQKDIYFSPRANPFFGNEINDECLRIRILKDKNILSYKRIFFGECEEDIHLEEHETEIVDLEQTKKILKCLKIDEVLTLHKIRHSFCYQEIFEIELDKVKDLGYFAEIEVLDSTLSVQEANKKLQALVTELSLDINRRNLDGYANLLYQKLYESRQS